MTSKELKNKPVAITSLDEVDGSVNSIFGYVAGTSSVRAKNDFLIGHMNALIEQILKDTYGGRKYFVKKYEICNSGNLTIDQDYQLFHSLLDQLANRELTGNAAIGAVEGTIGAFRPCDQVWLARILDGNLKIGAGNTFSKNTGTIDKYPCALANVLEKVKNVDIFDGNWMVSRKLDGCRCHAHVDLETGTVTMISRQGKEFFTLDKVKPEVLDFLSGMVGRWVLDGEICIVNENGDEDFQGLMSLVRRKDFTIEKPKYKVFDILTEDEFYGRETIVRPYKSFKYRYEFLQRCAEYYKGNIIDVVEQEWVTPESLDRWTERRIAGGWEGLMLRKDVPYEGKRTNNLLKLKPMQDGEYTVTSIIEGDLTYNTPSGSETIHGVSALTIEHKGNIVKVGSGMSRAQREEWVRNPSLIIGKTITVQYFEETVSKDTGEYSLRFPVLKFVYEDGRDC